MVQSCFVKLLQVFLRFLRNILILILAVFLLGSSNLSPGVPIEQVRAYTRQIEFDFIGWTLNTLRLKLFETAVGASNYLPESERHQLVIEYLALIQQILNREGDLEQIYADPSMADPRAASEQLRQELSRLYARRDQIGPVAEAILQEQIGIVVGEQGLSLGGQPVPPVLYHSTPLPLILVVSPRDTIRLDYSIALDPALTLDKQVELEDQVDHALNRSSLVEPIGGLGLYPTMVVQSSNLDWLSEVVSHEWVHNYLTLRPLGISYMDNPEMRVMNETTASIAGKEIGRAVLERFYPELVPAPPPPPSPSQSSETSRPAEPPAFDFRKEMQITRRTVDQMLADGKIDEAEQYMDARRTVFWDHGYHWLRKLNQAYFAFNGAYADEPGGAAGATEDPVGKAVRALRTQSVSLADFLNRISWMTSFEQLKKTVGSAQ
jgi:hypothetical protein